MPQLNPHRAIRFKQAARMRFDAWAHRYDRSFLGRHLFQPAYLTILEVLANWRRDHPGPFHLLDLGCGTGSLGELIRGTRWAGTVCGLDFSPSMCALAHAKTSSREAGGGGRVVAGDSEHLPFADGSFDFIACANSFHHYPHQRVVVAEIRRVLSPQGRAVIVDGFRDNAVGWFVFDVVVQRIEGDVHHAGWRELDSYFVDAGFNRVARRKVNVVLPLLATIADV